MSEQQPCVDLFASSGSLIDGICELQRTFVEVIFNNVLPDNSPGSDLSTLLHATSSCGENGFCPPNRVASSPLQVMIRQVDFWRCQVQLCNSFALRLLGWQVQPLFSSAADAQYCSDDERRENLLLDFMNQYYLLVAGHTLNCVSELQDSINADHQQFVSAVHLMIDALSANDFETKDVVGRHISARIGDSDLNVEPVLSRHLEQRLIAQLLSQRDAA